MGLPWGHSRYRGPSCDPPGVEYVAGENAPLVFFSGFTRSFLAGEQGTSAQWLQKFHGYKDGLSMATLWPGMTSHNVLLLPSLKQPISIEMGE